MRHAKFAGLALSESSILLLSAYLCYILADAATFSGIISILFFGQTAAHYPFYSLSAEVKISSRHFIKAPLSSLRWDCGCLTVLCAQVLAKMADTAVFVFLGMTFMNLDWSGIEWRFVGWVVVRLQCEY